MHAVGDEHLGAVEHVSTLHATRGGAHGGKIGAGVGLGHGDGRDDLARADPRHPPFVLGLVARMPEVRRGHVGVDQHRHREAAAGGAAQFLRQDRIGQRVEARAAVVRCIPHAKEAKRAHLAQDFTRHEALLLPGLDVRQDAVGDEAPDGLPEHRVLLAEVREAVDGEGGGHGGSTVAYIQAGAASRRGRTGLGDDRIGSDDIRVDQGAQIA